jgi:RNA polymerase sigma factor (TIGR02999 family)
VTESGVVSNINPEGGPWTFSALYPRLRAIARARLRFGRGALLDTTALVHESYIRLAESGNVAGGDWPSFLRYASCRRNANRHGGGAVHLELQEGMDAADGFNAEQTIAVKRALEQLELIDARLARVVEMRCFSGMTDLEIAHALGIVERTVRRDWSKARLLLLRLLGPEI